VDAGTPDVDAWTEIAERRLVVRDVRRGRGHETRRGGSQTRRRVITRVVGIVSRGDRIEDSARHGPLDRLITGVAPRAAEAHVRYGGTDRVCRDPVHALDDRRRRAG